MEYSFTPFVADSPDYGLYFFLWVLISLCILFVTITLDFMADKDIYIKKSIPLHAIVTSVILTKAMMQPVDPPPKNVELVGKKVSVFGEQQVGHKNRVSHHLYVVYNVDGNDVVFNAYTGIAYPDTITVYRKN